MPNVCWAFFIKFRVIIFNTILINKSIKASKHLKFTHSLTALYTFLGFP